MSNIILLNYLILIDQRKLLTELQGVLREIQKNQLNLLSDYHPISFIGFRYNNIFILSKVS